MTGAERLRRLRGDGTSTAAPEGSAVSSNIYSTDSFGTGGPEDKQAPNIPPDVPGLLTVYSGKLLTNILATTLCKGREQLKRGLIMIKHYKQKLTLAVVLALMLARLLTGCAVALGITAESSNGTVSKNRVSLEHNHEKQANNSDAQSSADSNLAAAISLSGVEPYEAPGVETTTVDSSDIASEIVSYVCDNGTEVMFYRAQNGDIYGAYRMNDDMVVRFIQGYWADNNWGYQDGYDIKPYDNVFGHDGFYVVYPGGAAFIAHDYYYFEPDGTLKLMIHCCNHVIAQDLDGDGATELLWFYHGGGLAYYCFEQDGVICEADLNALLTAEFPDWNIGFDQDSVHDGTLEMIYGLSGEDGAATYKGQIKFTEDSLMVYK